MNGENDRMSEPLFKVGQRVKHNDSLGWIVQVNKLDYPCSCGCDNHDYTVKYDTGELRYYIPSKKITLAVTEQGNEF